MRKIMASTCTTRSLVLAQKKLISNTPKATRPLRAPMKTLICQLYKKHRVNLSESVFQITAVNSLVRSQAPGFLKGATTGQGFHPFHSGWHSIQFQPFCIKVWEAFFSGDWLQIWNHHGDTNRRWRRKQNERDRKGQGLGGFEKKKKIDGEMVRTLTC